MCDDDGSEGHCDRAALRWLIYLTTNRAAAWLHLQRACTHGSDEPSHRSAAWGEIEPWRPITSYSSSVLWFTSGVTVIEMSASKLV